MYRNKKILAAAKGEACTMNSPMCNGNPETVVACHSNDQAHGKGRNIKAHDLFVFFGCHGCHHWFDNVPAPAAEKREAFYYAHGRTIQRLIDKGVLK